VANCDGIGFGLTEGHIIMSAQDSYGVWTFFYLSDQCSHGYMEEKKSKKKNVPHAAALTACTAGNALRRKRSACRWEVVKASCMQVGDGFLLPCYFPARSSFLLSPRYLHERRKSQLL
jgi:hypothetical protein